MYRPSRAEEEEDGGGDAENMPRRRPDTPRPDIQDLGGPASSEPSSEPSTVRIRRLYFSDGLPRRNVVHRGGRRSTSQRVGSGPVLQYLDPLDQQSDAERESQRRFYELLKPSKAKELFLTNNRRYGGFESRFPVVGHPQDVQERCEAVVAKRQKKMPAAQYEPATTVLGIAAQLEKLA